MKLYGTQKTKEEIEKKIRELEEESYNLYKEHSSWALKASCNSELRVYKQILADFVVLPEYKSWDEAENFPPDNESQTLKTLKLKQGVIINQNKQ
jgi:hypothetical protein